MRSARVRRLAYRDACQNGMCLYRRRVAEALFMVVGNLQAMLDVCLEFARPRIELVRERLHASNELAQLVLHAVETSVHPIESRVDSAEAGVDTPFPLFEARVDAAFLLLEARVNAASKTRGPLVHPLVKRRDSHAESAHHSIVELRRRCRRPCLRKRSRHP